MPPPPRACARALALRAAGGQTAAPRAARSRATGRRGRSPRPRSHALRHAAPAPRRAAGWAGLERYGYRNACFSLQPERLGISTLPHCDLVDLKGYQYIYIYIYISLTLGGWGGLKLSKAGEALRNHLATLSLNRLFECSMEMFRENPEICLEISRHALNC